MRRWLFRGLIGFLVAVVVAGTTLFGLSLRVSVNSEKGFVSIALAQTPQRITFVGNARPNPITFTETADYIRLDFTMFTIEFYKGTAGYNKVYDNVGSVLVYDDRLALEYQQAKQWKQRGVPYNLTWQRINDDHYEVTRYYTDYLGTAFTSVYTVKTDQPMKLTVNLSNGQLDNYRIAWYLSGIQKTQQAAEANSLLFGNQEKPYGWIAFDWNDIYQTFGEITTTSTEVQANDTKASIYFNIGNIAGGQTTKLDPSYVGNTSATGNNPTSGSWTLNGISWQAGDVAIFWWFTRLDSKTFTEPGTVIQKHDAWQPPGGWGRLFTGYRVLQAGDSTFAWTSSSVIGSTTIWGTSVFRGIDTSGDPFEAESGTPVSYGPVQNPDPPLVTTVTANAFALPVFGKQQEYTGITPPTNYASAGSNQATQGDDASAGVAYREIASPGTENPGAWTLTGGSSDYGMIWTGALKPTSANPAITVNPTSYDFGVVAESSTPSTITTYFLIDNTSAMQTDQTISVTTATWSGGVTWTHSDTATAGVNTAGLKANKGGTWGTGDVIVKYNATWNDIATNQAANTDYSFGLKLIAPTSFTDGVQKAIIVRITAAAG